jgi:hypothetical protein
MAYYGGFRHSELHPLLARISWHVQERIRHKYRRLRLGKAMKRAWNRITECWLGGDCGDFPCPFGWLAGSRGRCGSVSRAGVSGDRMVAAPGGRRALSPGAALVPARA